MMLQRQKDVRYAVVYALSRLCTMFYNFADGSWDSNRIKASSMFTDQAVAKAVLTALNEERRKNNQRAGYGSYCPLQIVKFKKSKNGGKILSTVMSTSGRYRPMLCRTSGAGRLRNDSD